MPFCLAVSYFPLPYSAANIWVSFFFTFPERETALTNNIETIKGQKQSNGKQPKNQSLIQSRLALNSSCLYLPSARIRDMTTVPHVWLRWSRMHMYFLLLLLWSFYSILVLVFLLPFRVLYLLSVSHSSAYHVYNTFHLSQVTVATFNEQSKLCVPLLRC